MHRAAAVRWASARLAWFLGWVLLFLAAPPVGAQRVSLDSVKVNDSTVVHAIHMREGSRIVGRIVAVTADSVRVVSASSTTTVSRGAVREVRQYAASAMHDGELWPENPHATRLLFSPTAIPLRKGEGYFSDFWLFVLSAAGGVTDRFTLGAGMTLIPGINFGDNVFYLLPKYTLVDQPRIKFAIGGLVALVGGFSSDSRDAASVGILYGVATTGTHESNLTLGAGWGYVGDQLADKPVVTLGGQHRVSKRVALISENWFLPFEGDALGFVTYGLRFLGEKLAVDFAFGNTLERGGQLFPGVPLLGFSVKF